MKVLFAGLMISTAIIVSCNQSNQKVTQEDPIALEPSTAINKKQPAYAGIKEVTDSYITLKNALAADKDKDAARSGEKMVKAFEAFNKSALPEDKQKQYADIEEDVIEHAEHIGKSTGNIKHQREHFAVLSKDMYDLAQLFGSGQPMYLVHCPMYDNNKGADWLSETKEINNPYFGKEMPDCGTIKEELKL